MTVGVWILGDRLWQNQPRLNRTDDESVLPVILIASWLATRSTFTSQISNLSCTSYGSSKGYIVGSGVQVRSCCTGENA